jgi:hypothetical protein
VAFVIQNGLVNSQSFDCEVLETVKIWSSRFAQGYHFAVDNRVEGSSWSASENLRELFVEVVVIPQVQGDFSTGLDSDGPIPVELNFVGPVWPSARFERRARAFGSIDSVFRFGQECCKLYESATCFKAMRRDAKSKPTWAPRNSRTLVKLSHRWMRYSLAAGPRYIPDFADLVALQGIVAMVGSE